ncbi:MAG TPA: hypothetical protein V6C89_06030 [Drouetiella sp.]
MLGEVTEQLQWLVDNHPRHLFHAQCRGFGEDKIHQRLKSHWAHQVASNADDVTVLYHAAIFSELSDSMYSAKLLRRASKLDTKNEIFPETLCGIYLRSFEKGRKSDKKKFAKLAVSEFKSALYRYETYCTEEWKKLYQYRFDITGGNVADSAIECQLFEEAQELAHLILGRTASLQFPLNTPGIHPGEVYGIISSKNTGGAILGKIAIAKNDLSFAVDRLNGLVVAEPYGHIENDLAQSLLACGEAEAVKLYLKRVEELHKTRTSDGNKGSNQMDAELSYEATTCKKIRRWIRKIDAGHIPRLERC